MKNQVKDPLDKLFSGLNNIAQERPSPAFVQDLEARLDALDKKRRKPLFAWWIFSAFGAVVLLSTYFLLVPVRAKSKVPKKLSSVAQSSHLSASKSKSTSSVSISNASSSTFATRNASSKKSSSLTSFATSISTSLSSLSSKAAAPSSEIIEVRQETYVINPILLSDDHIKDTALTLNRLTLTQPMPTLPHEAMPTKKRIQHQLGLQFGLSGIFSSFEVPTSNPLYTATELKQFRDTREIGERQTSSWDFNLRYGLSIGNWQLQTGLHYFEWGEQLQYEVISVSGTNRYRYVNLPLLVGYTFHLGKVQLLPFAGAAFGKCLSTQGTYIQPQVNGVALANAKQIAGTFIGQVELQYALTPQLSVTITPVYRRTMGALIDNGLVVNRYQSLGLLTGFLFKL